MPSERRWLDQMMLIACFNGHLNIVHFLCQNGAKDDVRRPRNNGSTLMFAVCEKGHSNIVQCLFQNGAKDDVRRPTNNGSTPMFIACYNDHFPIVEYLHNHGAAQDINAPSWQQQTPLQNHLPKQPSSHCSMVHSARHANKNQHLKHGLTN